MPIDGLIYEREMVRAFIQKPRQERLLLLLSNPKRRRDFTDELAHFRWLDEQFAHVIPPTTAHGVLEIVALLRKMGAGSTVWVISEDKSIDAQEMDLLDVMKQILGREIGTILSCVPGKLGFFCGEGMKSERPLVHP
jgi:hypothetical protein